MKYWFFDGNDVIGPFTPRELAARADFSVTTGLVCPENFSEDGDSWQPAASFADFGPDALSSGSAVSAPAKPSAAQEETSSPEEAALFDKEMDTFLKNPSILAGTAAPAPEGPSLEIPKKPAKPGPIEDYFNNINGEDLGDILGIPDPKENSDMNLPQVVDGPFENTTPPSDKEIDSVEMSAAEEEIDLSVPVSTSAVKNENLTQAALLAEQTQPVEKEEPVRSVPISVAQEEALVVLPGETPREAAAAAEPEDSAPQADAASVSQGTAVPQADAPQGVSSGAGAELAVSSKGDPAAVQASASEEETLSTCTLPVLGEQDNRLSLPAVPADGVPFVLPVQPVAAFVPQEELPPAQEPILQAVTAVEPVSSAPEKAVPPAGTEEPEGEASVQPQPADPEPLQEPQVGGKDPASSSVEPQVNQVKPRLKQTPEIERFLLTQSQIIRRSSQRKADFMQWVLVVLLVIGGVLLLLRFLPRPAASVLAPAKKAPRQTVQPADVVRRVQEPAKPAPVVPPVPTPLTAADKALAAVQNYPLPDGKGTISSYFDRIYKTQLAQGYTGEWSAEALHKNTYIVKYRLSKTRMEPIVYVFQADAAQQKLTGALNNIALDLVGRI